MAQRPKEIKAFLHLPESEHAIHQFEKKVCDFYAAQVEKKLRPLPKKEKLEILQALMDNFSS